LAKPEYASDRKGTQELLAEFLREAAVLVLVFGFLDLLKDGKALAWDAAITVTVISTLALISGIAMERFRLKSEK
jgi:hypothetical protein